MFGLIIWGVAVTVLAGLIAWVVTNRWEFKDYSGRKRITPRELAIGAAVCAVIIVPLTVFVGNKIALANNLEYNEYWSGYEIEAVKSVTDCTRDGPCHYEYDCDPYEVAVTKTRTVSDGKGGTRTETYVEYETRYHDCPYATQEWSFGIRTTLDDFHIERTFPDNAQRFRSGRGLPSNIRQGTPPFWQAAHDRIAAGDPGPVTVRRTYDNYILASQSSILREFSSAVEAYADVLPAPASTVRNFYYADKAYFVGMDAAPGWTDAVMRFNAAFGSDLQGDLHVVIVDEQVTSNPDEFVGALNAHWTGEEFGRDALSKNGLVVVLGTDGRTVTWARGFTGMPVGNEALLADIRRELDGLRLDPATVLGTPVGVIANGDFDSVRHGDGTLERLVWGTNQFERVCMTCKEEGGNGFGYLGSEIQPTTGQKVAIVAVAFVLSLLVWAGFVMLGSDKNSDSIRARWY